MYVTVRWKSVRCFEVSAKQLKQKVIIIEASSVTYTESYRLVMQEVHQAGNEKGKDIVLKEEKLTKTENRKKNVVNGILTGVIVLLVFGGVIYLLKRKK